MNIKKNYYKILNVDFFSNAKKIKDAYRKLAMKYHPDRNYGNKEFEEKFKEIAEAYEILSNRKSRRHYNILYVATNRYILPTFALGFIIGTILFKKSKN